MGRFGWAAISDKIGRRATFNIFTLGAVPIFATLPYFIGGVVSDPNGPLATVSFSLPFTPEVVKMINFYVFS